MRYKRFSFLSLLFTLILVSCQQIAPVLVGVEKPPVAADIPQPATRTPFQAASSTPRPTFTATPTIEPSPTTPPCAAQPGRFEEKQAVFSGGAPLHFRVYFPPCFDENQGAHYPVLYLIHGQTSKDDQWQRLGIGDAADRLISEGSVPPFMIVLPQEDDTFADIYVESFGRDVTNGLVPWIDATYPTCAERACRAIGGLSRGGAWALHLGFTRWDLFGSVGMHSTPPFNTDPGLFPTWLSKIPDGQVPRVYMDSGRRDAFLSMSSAFEAELVNNGVSHEWYLFNGQHDEEYWSAHVADYLVWYAQPWQELR